MYIDWHIRLPVLPVLPVYPALKITILPDYQTGDYKLTARGIDSLHTELGPIFRVQALVSIFVQVKKSIIGKD